MTSRSHRALLLLAWLIGCGGSSEPPAPPPPENSAPALLGVTSSQSYLGVGTTTQLSVSATDADGDDLHYRWRTNCLGTFTGEDSARATFTPTALPPSICHNCRMDVEVEDGHGGLSTGRLWLCVSKNAQPSEAPVILRAQQSNPTGTTDPVLTLDVEALDVQGARLGFEWKNTANLLGTITSTATTSRFTSTGLTCAPEDAPPEFTVTVRNALGLRDTRTFTVTGLPACARWTTVGALGTARDQHTATLLPDGKVLVVGGYDGKQALASAELYDPATRTWHATGAMATPRYAHTATLLPSGKVLVVGSHDSQNPRAELYDPATGTWSPTGSLAAGRSWHTATPLPDGQVLVVGGYTAIDDYTGRYEGTTELYDPATGAWSPASADRVPRAVHQAALLPNGRVLIAGGSSDPVSTDEYTPAPRIWNPTRRMPTGRSLFTLTPLPEGRWLAAGNSSADVYDPDSGRWSRTSPPVAELLTCHVAAALPDGRVLITGGGAGRISQALAPTAQIYAPATGRWTLTGPMTVMRTNHTATRLRSGQVLVVGGVYNSGNSRIFLASAELYDPTTGP